MVIKHFVQAFVFLIGIIYGLLANAQTTQAMAEDACLSFKKVDALLNSTYHTILQKHHADKNFIEKFKRAQRAWIQFRDAELDAIYPYQNTEPERYGKVLSMCHCSMMEDLTQKRLKELKEWVDGQEGDVCAGSRTVD